MVDQNSDEVDFGFPLDPPTQKSLVAFTTSPRQQLYHISLQHHVLPSDALISLQLLTHAHKLT